MSSNEQYIIKMMEAAVDGVLKGCDASEILGMQDYTRGMRDGMEIIMNNIKMLKEILK